MGKDYKLVGVCVASVHEDYNTNIIQTMCRVASRNQIKLLIYTTFHSLEEDGDHQDCSAGVYQLLDYDLLDAVIILGESIKNQKIAESIVRRATEHGTPAISIDYPLEGCYNVRFGYADAFEQIVRHMVAYHGYRRINLIAGIQGNPFEQERTNAYRKVLADYDIPIEEERIGYGNFWAEPTYEVVDRFLESSLPFPEVIVCENDSMAIATCKRLRQHGKNVPNNVCVSGFDGIPVAMNYTPRITTAEQDFEGMAQTCAELIHDLCNNTCKRDIRKVIEIPFMPVYQNSCGCYSTTRDREGGDIIEAYGRLEREIEHDSYVLRMKNSAIRAKDVIEFGKRILPFQVNNNWKCVANDYPTGNLDVDAPYDENEQARVFDFEEPIYPEQMKVFMQVNAEADTWGNAFETKKLLPNFDEIIQQVDHLLVTPLYFAHQMYGYEVFEYTASFFVDLGFEKKFATEYNLLLNTLKKNSEMRLIAEVLREKNDELNLLYLQDYLTKLYNRRGFIKKMENLYQKAKRGVNCQIFVLTIDMDGLKQINDTFGHEEGDYSILAIADVLKRMSEDYESLVCSRFGGDEFEVGGLLNTENDITGELIDYINNGLEVFNQKSQKPYIVRASIGAVISKIESGETLETVMNLADQRMYVQKEGKKQRRLEGDQESYKVLRTIE